MHGTTNERHVVGLDVTKRMIEELWPTTVKNDLEVALKHHMQARASSEAREGIGAFNEKRKPNWVS